MNSDENIIKKTEKIEVIQASDIDGFDDIIIDQANERITQEIEISSSTETKANVLLGVIGLIFTITSTIGFNFFITVLKENIYLVIPLVMATSLLAVSFSLSFAIIKPRIKFDLINPRKANNLMHDWPIQDVKYNIKYSLIKNFEYIQKEGKKDLSYLRYGFNLFIAGIVLFSIPLFVHIYIEFISKIHGS